MDEFEVLEPVPPGEDPMLAAAAVGELDTLRVPPHNIHAEQSLVCQKRPDPARLPLPFPAPGREGTMEAVSLSPVGVDLASTCGGWVRFHRTRRR